MKNIERVDFSDVLKRFDREHPINQETNEWARDRLKNANERFGGEWYSVQLSRREVLSGIELVYHHDPGSGLVLIPEEGSTVSEAKDKFLKIRLDYSKKNSDCYEKIVKFGSRMFDYVFLCTAPLKGFGVTEHEKLDHTEENLVHIDGLHRLVAWAVKGRLGWFRYNVFSKKIYAFVAGDVNIVQHNQKQ